jgi:hypothetical protein
MNSEEYTSLVISASAIAISGGSIDSQPVCTITKSISFPYFAAVANVFTKKISVIISITMLNLQYQNGYA